MEGDGSLAGSWNERGSSFDGVSSETVADVEGR